MSGFTRLDMLTPSKHVLDGIRYNTQHVVQAGSCALAFFITHRFGSKPGLGKRLFTRLSMIYDLSAGRSLSIPHCPPSTPLFGILISWRSYSDLLERKFLSFCISECSILARPRSKQLCFPVFVVRAGRGTGKAGFSGKFSVLSLSGYGCPLLLPIRAADKNRQLGTRRGPSICLGLPPPDPDPQQAARAGALQSQAGAAFPRCWELSAVRSGDSK